MTKILFAVLLAAVVLLLVRAIAGVPLSLLWRRHVGARACAILGHRRDGASVRRTEGGYHARCRRCGAALGKAVRQDAWVAIGPALAAVGDHPGRNGTRGGGEGHVDTVTREERGA